MAKEKVYLIKKGIEETGQEMSEHEVLDSYGLKLTSSFISALQRLQINESLYYNEINVHFHRIK